MHFCMCSNMLHPFPRNPTSPPPSLRLSTKAFPSVARSPTPPHHLLACVRSLPSRCCPSTSAASPSTSLLGQWKPKKSLSPWMAMWPKLLGAPRPASIVGTNTGAGTRPS
ncbi:hypothetical protein EV356DRAFT_62714 [Viridothelium virens]|uniref:Uncharacterized protein n=1 Tax=Viridothelium virens TaxID=1048519 RepID=A0A6A6HEN0_VIRVR|nr:hypothetical protein EV356DRAFT_62714 [Viridothelium virens]